MRYVKKNYSLEELTPAPTNTHFPNHMPVASPGKYN